ncbi:MAG: ABC transporter permease [Trueperaceae bacterium]|nr:MAG: ABC transporter permease [Trueperaceae bacterium]
MFTFIVRRFFSALISIVLASMLVFSALLAVPGDPAEIILGLNASPEALAALREKLGLTVPAPQRYLNWLTGIVRGDLGESLNYQKDVSELIIDRLAVSVPLALGAALIACFIALPLGILAALKRNTFLDPLVTAISQVGAAIPSFWLGLMLILFFAVELRWLPAGGYVPWERDPLGTLRSLLLPIIALGLGQAAVMTRMTRASMIEVLNQDYIRTAKAKGLSGRRVVMIHGLRNALVTLITILGLSLTNVFIGSIIIEQVFALPGLGRLALIAIGTRDFPLLQGEILVYAGTIVFLSFLVDISYGFLDPTIRYA